MIKDDSFLNDTEFLTHDWACRCRLCFSYWKQIFAEDGDNGPFTVAELNNEYLEERG
jgi:hypothetical protein